MNKLLAQYEEMVAQGNPEGYYFLGDLYINGLGVDKDPEKAFNLFKLGVENNDPKCYYTLGVCYLNGFGTEVDFELAQSIFTNGYPLILEAANNNDPVAAFLIGNLYYYGYFKQIPQDLNQAIVWYEKSAALNYSRAAFILGLIYESGKLGVKDDALAVQWYQKGALLGNDRPI